MIDLSLMDSELQRDEGYQPHVYQDSLGFWTIGNGFLVDKRRGGTLPEPVRALWLSLLVQECVRDIQNEPWFLACDTDARRRALVNMRFQLGAGGLRTFRRSLAAIQARKWLEAGALMRQSLWYKQTPMRAERVIRMIESGEAARTGGPGG